MVIPDEVTLEINNTLWVIAEVTGVIMFPCLMFGLLVAVFQAATQINEQSLSFIPKLLIIFAILIYGGGYLLGLITGLFERLLLAIPLYALG